MRYPASEKAEIIELVEQSHLPAKRPLDKLGSGERVQGQNHRNQPTLANRLHRPQDHRLGLVHLSTVLDDFSRYIVAWRLGPTMCASDVTATLDQALAAS